MFAPPSSPVCQRCGDTSWYMIPALASACRSAQNAPPNENADVAPVNRPTDGVTDSTTPNTSPSCRISLNKRATALKSSSRRVPWTTTFLPLRIFDLGVFGSSTTGTGTRRSITRPEVMTAIPPLTPGSIPRKYVDMEAPIVAH